MKPSIKFLSLFFVCAAFSATAQQKIIAMSVMASSPSADTTEYGVPIIDSTTLFTAMMSIILDNGDSIYQIHVKLGSTSGGSEFLSATFDYGASGTFGNTSYSQSGNNISLGLGAHAGMIHYYAEVQIEKTDHALEDAVLFSNN